MKRKSKVINALLITGFLVLLLAGANSIVYAQEGNFFLPELEPSMSADGLTLYNAVPPLVVVADPNPYRQGIKAPGPTAADALAAPEAASSTFSITYVAAGGADEWGEPCYAFPAEAKTAFNAAAAIWAKTLKSSVPITIKACWADLGSSSGILGYSGAQPVHHDFAGAPKANTLYEGALANSLAGSDLDPSSFDMNITYNKYFTWYYGTDGNPPGGQYDLVTVAAHEMGHGLNFSGSASYSGGTGSFGVGGRPLIYDTFMENNAGKALTTYANPSAALGTLLTSNDLWFNGANAKAANGGVRPKMYAPSTWAGGSSYSHLDYNTFAGTSNSMMVYAVASGSANHNPGAVTTGLMKDLGWQLATASNIPTPQAPSGNITDTTPTYTWTKVTGATQYRYQLMQGTTLTYTKTVASTVCGASTCSNTPANVLGYLPYKWKVQAMVGGVWKAYSAFKTFTVNVPVPTPQAPSGTITDNTPTYKWTKVAGATQYRFQLNKGTTVVYTKTVPSSACGTTTCSTTPTNTLGYFAYKWKVQAAVGTTWSSYSAFKNFSVTAAVTKPKAGFWEEPDGLGKFYVTTNQANVDEFAIYIDLRAYPPCTTYWITYHPLVPISNNKFSFSGAFYASGTFDSATTVHGTTGLNYFYIPDCGYVTGGPANWTGAWKDNSQPAIAAGGTAASVIAAPETKGLTGFTVKPD